MYKRFNGLRPKEWLLLISLPISTWLFGLIYYHSDLKFKYYVNTDKEFMSRLDGYFHSSTKAQKKMTNWLASNYKLANLSSPIEPLFFNRKSTKLKLCVAILTKSRHTGPDRDYVSQTVVSLLARVKLVYQEDLRIILFNADSSQSSLENLANLVHIESIKQPSSIHANLNNFGHMKKLKEAVDYINVMQTLYKYKDCKYGLLIEDDSIAAPDWYNKLMNALKDIEIKGQETTDQWLCLKLFTSYRYHDWLTHLPTVVSSVMLIVISSIFQLLLFHLLRVSLKRGTFAVFGEFRNYFSIVKRNQHAMVNLLIILNQSLFVAFIQGSSIKPLGYGTHKYSQGFNTVAMLYPRKQLNLFSNYLETIIQDYLIGKIEKMIPKDLAMNSYIKQMELSEYIIEPSIVQHVGVHSSLRNFNKNPENILQNQYRPFQSYSFMKNFDMPVEFDPVYWTMPD